MKITIVTRGIGHEAVMSQMHHWPFVYGFIINFHLICQETDFLMSSLWKEGPTFIGSYMQKKSGEGDIIGGLEIIFVQKGSPKFNNRNHNSVHEAQAAYSSI